MQQGRFSRVVVFVVFLLSAISPPGQSAAQTSTRPWMNSVLPPDQRADLVLAQMTEAEKLQMVHGLGWGIVRSADDVSRQDLGGAGFVPGIKRLGIPDINLADSAVGISMAALRGRYATLLPSTLGLAASWDRSAASLYGAVIGRELRAQGFNMSIGGGVNLIREPRNGRNFEYAGEDPLLAGVTVGEIEKAVQSQHVMSDIKHFALNDQETGRNVLNVVLDRKSLQESDLLAFQIAIGIAQPSAVMCSYNRVNGTYACENDLLLNQTLKQAWGFKGWVLSDWEGTHSTVKAAVAGLDQEQPGTVYFGEALHEAVGRGQVPQSRLDDMVHRILRSMFAAGVVDDAPVPSVVDPFQGRDDAQRIAEESIVLLKNDIQLLPLRKSLHSIVLIGSHADVGLLSGGGSAQVDAPGGNAADPEHGGTHWGQPVYFPSSPLKEIQSKLSSGSVSYVDGHDQQAAARAAKQAEVAIVFASQYMSEGMDAPTLALPNRQDELIRAVAAANPNTIVVLETGGPVTMPWLHAVHGVFEAWYPGIGGAQALASLLFGDVSPSAKLPVTFAASDEDLPHPQVIGRNSRNHTLGNPDGSSEEAKAFDVAYTEGARVGYKWFESEQKKALFPFGFGLSYTTFGYSDLRVDSSRQEVTFNVSNTGALRGAEIAEVYVQLPASTGERFKRLAGWQRVSLAPGERRSVRVKLETKTISVFDEHRDAFTMVPGRYKVFVGGASEHTQLVGTLTH